MRKMMKKLFAAVLSLSMIASLFTLPMNVGAESNELRFNSNGKFKIVIFSDTQDRYVVHPRLTSIMRQAIARENPDFVVFTGDMTEQNIKDPDVDFRKTLNQILAPVVEANIPYSVVFGNHDDQSYYDGQRTDKDAMLRVYQSIGDCRTVDADPSIYGTGTCNIPIYSSTGNNMAFNLWMIDSNTYQNPLDTGSGYDNPHADQLAWLQAQHNAITAAEGHVVPSFAFQHIPMPEIWNLYVEDANGKRTYGDKKYNLALKSGVTGHAGEFPNSIYAADNKGEYNVLKQMGVWNLFTGHDHLNDFSGKFEADGVTMTAVPGMTYANYGDEAIRGYGVIELDENDLANYEYHTVKFSTLDAEAGTPAEETYDVYDELKVSDLKKNGTPLSGSVNIGGGNLYTYDATSPSKSAVLKFRWTVGSSMGIQFSFDHRINSRGDREISYPFGVWVKKPNDSGAGSTGAWHLRPDESSRTMVPFSVAPKQGDTFDVEFGRLKVVTGAPENVGQYYLYLKVDGELIMSTYTAVDDENGYTAVDADCVVTNEMFFADWGRTGNKISDIPVVETYDDYDEFNLSGLGFNPGNFANEIPAGAQTYTGTSASHSLVMKFKWQATNQSSANDATLFNLCADANWNYGKFGIWARADHLYFCYELDSDLPGTVRVLDPITTGTHDIELGRKLVTSGPNAGKYYVYLMVDGEVKADGYTSYYTSTAGYAMNNIIYIGGEQLSDQRFADIAISENYDTYDELTLSDLGLNPGNFENAISAGSYNYIATSSSDSVVLKFKWQATTEGIEDNGDDSALCFSLDKDYAFDKAGILARYSKIYSCYNDSQIKSQSATSFNFTPEGTHDVEFGRKLVLTGPNAGKYYMYLCIDNELLVSGYTDANYDYAKTNRIWFGGKGLSYQRFADVETGSEDPDDSIYYDYDEISYNGLLLNGQPLSNETTLTGQTIFTYNRTSPTHSAILRFRWTAGTVAKFTTFFDQSGAYPFTLCAKYPNQDNFGTVAGENGAWQVNPTTPDTLVNLNEALVSGQTYDVEFGRLKVKKGENAGKYYVYLKVDDEDVVGYYYDGVNADGSYYNGCQLSDNIVFEVWGTENTKISASPVKEQYDAYDELNFTDLYLGGQPVTGEVTLNGGQTYTYNRTSPSYSAILHFNWTAGDVAKFQMSFDKTADGSMSYPFGVWVREPNGDGAGANGDFWFMPGETQGLRTDFDHALAAGEKVEFELGRLKVVSGPNAGKYYTYLKMNKQLIAEAYNEVGANGQYTFGANEMTLTNEIMFGYWSGAVVNNLGKLSPVEIETVYEPYDELNFTDLYLGGQPVTGEVTLSGGQIYTYDRTSPSYSAILHFKWKAGDVAKFQMSFDHLEDGSMSYPFGIWVKEPFGDGAGETGAYWFLPGQSQGVQNPFNYALAAGDTVDFEIGRLKIKSGPNAGKYYTYLKVDKQLVAEAYIEVGANGQYTFGANTLSLSNEIMFGYWSGAVVNNLGKLGPVAPDMGDHEGLRGDIDNNGIVNAADVVGLKQVILGVIAVADGIADYNLDGAVDVRDLVAMKKDFAAANIHTRTGALAFGLQEHVNEDGTGANETKTPAFIADATATMGATHYRLGFSINRLFHCSGKKLSWNEEQVAILREQIDELTQRGITEILYVSDAFVIPSEYVYVDGQFIGHNITIPDPETEHDMYVNWLNINSEAFRMLVTRFPEIKYVEPYNEPNLTTSRMEKIGVGWNATAEEQAAYKFTVKEKAGIMADVCWYVSKAVKSVNPAIQVTTPAISYANVKEVEKNFVDELYKCIESGNYPTGQTVADKRIDNYFFILAVHVYPDFQNRSVLIDESGYVGLLNEFYNIVKAHGDGGSRVWLTETGISDNGTRNKTNVAANMKAALNALDTQVTFVDVAFIYKLSNVSEDNGWSSQETNYGIFYSGDDLDNPYVAKPIAKTIYSFFHNNTTDYSALTALTNRWAN